MSEEMDRSVPKDEHRRLYDKRGRRREQMFANMAAHIIKMCLELHISTLLIGDLCGLAHDKPCKGNTNMWGYRKLIARMSVSLENYGIAAFAVPEYGTLKVCARHGCEV